MCNENKPKVGMKVHLPNSAFLGNIDPFFNSIDTTDTSSLEITFNEKWVSVHPIVLSMVSALWLLTKDKSNLKIQTLEAKSKNYFERIGLFKILEYDSGISIVEHDPSGRFIPITIVRNSNELNNFIRDMVPLLHHEPEQVTPIKYAISELVRNVFEHSKSNDGAIIAAQYYKRSNTIRIGVADNGMGIRNAINKSYNIESDINAIGMALTPGITGTTRNTGGTELNAGAGLFFIKSIAKVNRDFFVIYSGNAMYKLLRTPTKAKQIRLYSDPFKDRCSKKTNLPYWQGTAVGIDICLDRHQAFNELLDSIKKVYRKNIKEKKKKRFKKPRFI